MNGSYFVTAIEVEPLHISDKWILKSRRCFGHFSELEEACVAVEENRGEMHECIYFYIVIEKIEYGIHSCSKKIKWFYWEFEGNSKWEQLSGKWVECEEPEWAQNVANFAIG